MMNYNSEDWGVNQTSEKPLRRSFLFAAARFMLIFLQLFRTFKQDVIVAGQNVKQDNERKHKKIDEHEENYQQHSPIIRTRVPFKVFAIQFAPKMLLIKRMTYEDFLVIP